MGMGVSTAGLIGDFNNPFSGASDYSKLFQQSQSSGYQPQLGAYQPQSAAGQLSPGSGAGPMTTLAQNYNSMFTPNPFNQDPMTLNQQMPEANTYGGQMYHQQANDSALTGQLPVGLSGLQQQVEQMQPQQPSQSSPAMPPKDLLGRGLDDYQQMLSSPLPGGIASPAAPEPQPAPAVMPPAAADFDYDGYLLERSGSYGISNGQPGNFTPVTRHEEAQNRYFNHITGGTSKGYAAWRAANPGKNVFDITNDFDKLSAKERYSYLPPHQQRSGQRDLAGSSPGTKGGAITQPMR